jgi:Ni,Fe-hydrogenase I large subunit
VALQTVVVDPVVRLAGHMSIELDVEDGVVRSAKSSGTSFRGIENILVGRPAADAVHLTQRICGVCPVPHGRAACECLEQAANVTVNDQARVMRNLLQAANFIDSHLLHLYVLSLPDWVPGLAPLGGAFPDVVRAAFEDGADLDPGGFTEHVAASLEVRRACHGVSALLGGRHPHAVGIVAGGATARPDEAAIATMQGLVDTIRAFVDGPLADDVQALAAAHPAYARLGAAQADFLSFGGFSESDGSLLFAPGRMGTDEAAPGAVDDAAILEAVGASRYQAEEPLHPARGRTVPELDRSGGYTWIKAPRLDGRPCEVGPLARAVLGGRDPGCRGVWGRYLARASECSLLAAAMQRWLSELPAGGDAYPASFPPDVSGAGRGLLEAPRGALGHWCLLEAGKIAGYQIVAPTTWNASPRDDGGRPGPLERALEGLAVADVANPVEALRVVRSFDPCLQCAVH